MNCDQNYTENWGTGPVGLLEPPLAFESPFSERCLPNRSSRLDMGCEKRYKETRLQLLGQPQELA